MEAGRFYEMKSKLFFMLGSVRVTHPQLTLDNVNYIQKRVFVSHIIYGSGITTTGVALVEVEQTTLPTYLTQAPTANLMADIEAARLQVLDDDGVANMGLAPLLEPEPVAVQPLFVQLRLNAAQLITDHNDDLQRQINRLSQRKMNHFFSDKQRHTDLKKFLTEIALWTAIQQPADAPRLDEWRLKLQLGGH